MTPKDLVQMGYGDFILRVNGKEVKLEDLFTVELYTTPPIQFVGHFLEIGGKYGIRRG